MQHRFAMLAVTGLLALSACGQQTTPTTSVTTPVATTPVTPPGATTPAPPKVQDVPGCATITVDLEGITTVGGAAATAPVIVTDSSGAQAFSGTATDLAALSQSFPAGTYTVKAGTIQGYAASNSPQTVTLDCDANKAKTVVLQFKTAAVTQAAVASLSFSGDVTDAQGVALPMNAEKNNSKNVNLYASQTEEPVLVTMTVKDASGKPVSGAAVNVNVDSLNVALVGGHVSMNTSTPTSSLKAQAAAPTAVAYSDDAGVVRFTAFATNQANPDDPNVPVKFVVTATGTSGTTPSAALLEFKTFFINMGHLYLNGQYSGQRVGKVFDTTTSNWFDQANRAKTFTVTATRKQPTSALLPIGDPRIPGYVKFDVTGTGITSSTTTNALTLNTADGTKAADLPLSAAVKATYHYTVNYGPERYDFPLKDVSFGHVFSGTTLSVVKTGPKIETWTGSDHHNPYAPDDVTLLQAMDPDGKATPETTLDNFSVGKTYEYTITVTNTGKATANNVIIRDTLPAELGFVQGSVTASKDGALLPQGNLLSTYNFQRHAFNLSFTGTAGLGDLEVGKSIVVKFKVYPRHKPGYFWNDNNRDGASDPLNAADPTYAYGENAPVLGSAYKDPYKVVNHAIAQADNAGMADGYEDIYVVRPSLTFSKKARTHTVGVNEPVTFDITVSNINRATQDPDPAVRAGYAALGALGDEGFAYRPRIEDSYGYNLDFLNAYDEAGTRVNTLEQVGNNALGLNLADLGAATSKTLSVVFQAEKSSKGESGQPFGNNTAPNGNCARFYAWNLNQPYPYASRGLEESALKAQALNILPLSLQYEGLDPYYDSYLNLNGQNSAVIRTERGIDAQGRNYLVSCDEIEVVDTQPSFDLDLYDAARGSNGTVNYTPNPTRLTDAQDIPQGSYYEYDYSFTNESEAAATTVKSVVTLPPFATLNDLGIRYTRGGVNTNYSLSQLLAGVNTGSGTLKATVADRTVTLTLSTMSAHDRLFAQFVMLANQVGAGKATSTLDWDQNNTGAPLPEDEYTKVTQH